MLFGVTVGWTVLVAVEDIVGDSDGCLVAVFEGVGVADGIIVSVAEGLGGGEVAVSVGIGVLVAKGVFVAGPGVLVGGAGVGSGGPTATRLALSQ